MPGPANCSVVLKAPVAAMGKVVKNSPPTSNCTCVLGSPRPVMVKGSPTVSCTVEKVQVGGMGVLVGVNVGVRVAVAVAVGVGMAVGVAVSVAVLVAVAVGRGGGGVWLSWRAARPLRRISRSAWGGTAVLVGVDSGLTMI